MSLKQQAISSVKWTGVSYIGRAFLQFMQLLILARFLDQHEFGVIAIILAITAFAQIFADAGVSNAIIHVQEIDQRQLSTLYWLNLLTSLIVASLLLLLSAWLVEWYQNSDLMLLLTLAAITLFINSIGQQLRVRAQKELNFKPLAKLELLSTFLGFLVTVYSLVNGFGAASIMVGALGAAIVMTLLTWLWLSEGWAPSPVFILKDIGYFIKFGVYMVGNNLVNVLNSQVDVLLGGRLLGLQSIGLYSLPKSLNTQIANVVNPMISQVGLPVMAKLQNDKRKLKSVYLQIILVTASVNAPIYIGLMLFAPEIVTILLGVKWGDATPLLQVLALWGFLRSTGNPVGYLLLALGRADLSFRWNLIISIIIIPLIWVSSKFGVIGIAAGMVFLMLILFFPNWYYLVKPLTGAGFNEYLKQYIVPVSNALVAAALSFILISHMDHYVNRLFFGGVVFLAIYCVGSFLFNHRLVDIINEFRTKQHF